MFAGFRIGQKGDCRFQQNHLRVWGGFVMSEKNHQIDVEKTQKFAQEVFSHLAGALVSGMIHLGERMGLYRALNGAGPLTSAELARKTGLNERWVREWLYQQAAANVIEYTGESRFELSPESAL